MGTRDGTDLKTGLSYFRLRGFVEDVPMGIGQNKGHEPSTKLPLGNYDYLFAFALNARLGPANQLMCAFGRH